MHIVVFEAESWETPAFDRLREEHDIKIVNEPLKAKNVEEHQDAEIVSVFIYSKLNAEVLEKLPSLRFIATRSTGVDHVDKEYCHKHGIPVSNVPRYGEQTVAEHVFGLLTMISHHLFEAVDRTRRGSFSQQGLRGFDLAGKVLGVVGTGDIGLNVIRIAKGYSMEVLAHDIEPREELARELDFHYVELNELIRRSDIITLHVPGLPATRGLISDEQFAMMKKGTVLINTSRGSIVNARAMVHALVDGTLSAAGLDVLAEEPTIHEEAELLRTAFQKEQDLETLLADHLLLRQRNVFITPHSAFNTKEAVQRILETTAENIAAYCEGKLQNVAIRADT